MTAGSASSSENPAFASVCVSSADTSAAGISQAVAESVAAAFSSAGISQVAAESAAALSVTRVSSDAAGAVSAADVSAASPAS